MELNFKTKLVDTADISLFAFDKVIDKEFDLIEDINIEINWRGIVYSRDYGITDIFPIIDTISIEMKYSIFQEDINKEDEKSYNLILNHDNMSEHKDKEWDLDTEYTRRQKDDTHLFITGIEIDFESKEIMLRL